MSSSRQFHASLIDTHVHLDVAAFAADRDAVIARARAAEIGPMIIPGIRRADWPGIRDTAAGDRRIYACYGLHPLFLADHSEDDLLQLAHYLAREPCVAVGECGLDYRLPALAERDGTTLPADWQEQQQWLFAGQLALAREFSLPVIVHAVKAVEDAIAMVRDAGVPKGVFHSFSGSAEQARQLITMGWHIGIGGAATHDTARKTHQVVKALPLDALVLETDAPWQPPDTHRGERNEPAYLRRVLDVVASLRPESEQTIAAATRRNARGLFGLG